MAKRPSPSSATGAAAAQPDAPRAGAATASARRGNVLFGWALGLSLLIHALTFTVSFRMPDWKAGKAKDPGLDVVLVNARHARAPEKAEALAQANLDGGGNVDQEVRAKSPLPPQPRQRDGDALTETHRRQPQAQSRARHVLTQARKPAPAVAAAVEQAAPPAAEPPKVSGLDLLDNAAAIARMEAQIDRDLQEYAKRPRRKFIGSRTKEYRFAQYVEDWRQKIERVGTLNYPEAARGKLYGSLQLAVTLRADGTVEKVEIHRSSGYKVLDEAALRIVGLASPFAPFPPDIRRDTDILEIVRTWTFTNHDQVHAN